MTDNNHDDDGSDHVFVARLEAARQRKREVGWSDHSAWLAARDNELAAERALAAHRGEPYAVVIDIGVRWDIGAPLPHLVTNGSRATVICRVGEPDPGWDGTYVTIVSPSDDTDDLWAIIELWGCSSVRIGALNDEAIEGHPLAGRGLCAYEAHEVHNSAWLDDHIRINAVHPNHSDELWRRQRHLLLAFHDEIVEALATGIEASVTRNSLRSLLTQATENIIDQPHRAPS
jgi:hypothetical protein